MFAGEFGSSFTDGVFARADGNTYQGTTVIVDAFSSSAGTRPPPSTSCEPSRQHAGEPSLVQLMMLRLNPRPSNRA